MSIQKAANQCNNRTPSIHSVQTGALRKCYSHILGRWPTKMGKTEQKWCVAKQKTEEQLPKRDYKETLLTDMKSKFNSIIYM